MNIFSRTKLVSILLLSFFIIVLAPSLASAQGLVECTEGGVCNACDVIDTFYAVYSFLFQLSIVIATIILVITGVRLVVSRGNPEAKSRVVNQLLNIFVGIFIIAVAFLLVDTVTKLLTGGTYGPWNRPAEEICGKQKDVADATASFNLKPEEVDALVAESHEYEADIEDNFAGPRRSGPDDGFRSGSSVVPSGNLVSYQGAKFDSAIVSKVSYVAETFGLRVSGGHRTPERNRAVGGVPNSNHLTGRAADFVGPYTNMQKAEVWAEENGAREALIHDAGSGTHLHLAW